MGARAPKGNNLAMPISYVDAILSSEYDRYRFKEYLES